MEWTPKGAPTGVSLARSLWRSPVQTTAAFGYVPAALNCWGIDSPYFSRHQSNMPPMRPPESNAFFCLASRLS